MFKYVFFKHNLPSMGKYSFGLEFCQFVSFKQNLDYRYEIDKLDSEILV